MGHRLIGGMAKILRLTYSLAYSVYGMFLSKTDKTFSVFMKYTPYLF